MKIMMMITIFHTWLTYETGAFDDEPMDEVEQNAVEEQPHDELGQVLVDA
jgi:hypothetical protein